MPGSHIEFAGMQGGKKVIHIYGEIVEAEKESILTYIDRPGRMYHHNHANLTSRVNMHYEQIGGATRFMLANDHFSKNNAMQNETKQRDLILSNLKNLDRDG